RLGNTGVKSESRRSAKPIRHVPSAPTRDSCRSSARTRSEYAPPDLQRVSDDPFIRPGRGPSTHSVSGDAGVATASVKRQKRATARYARTSMRVVDAARVKMRWRTRIIRSIRALRARSLAVRRAQKRPRSPRAHTVERSLAELDSTYVLALTCASSHPH